MPEALIYKIGPQPGGSLYVPDVPNNREGPQAREPSKCLNGQSYGERLAKEAFCSSATRGSKKDSDRAITPVAEAVHVPAHWSCQGPCKPSSCATFMINSHWGKTATGKKKSCVYTCRVTSVISIYTMEYYSAIERNTFESVLMR